MSSLHKLPRSQNSAPLTPTHPQSPNRVCALSAPMCVVFIFFINEANFAVLAANPVGPDLPTCTSRWLLFNVPERLNRCQRHSIHYPCITVATWAPSAVYRIPQSHPRRRTRTAQVETAIPQTPLELPALLRERKNQRHSKAEQGRMDH